jgi:Heparinase II/III-like protein/Heparinase II/III N-terminus
MQPGEMLWRASSMARLPLDIAGKALESGKNLHQPEFAWWEQSAYPIAHHRNGGSYPSTSLLGLNFPPDFEFDWHRDYSTNKVAPRTYAGRIDIRDPEAVGDVKCTWEISRHQHLSALAYSDHPASEQIVTLALRSWIDSNPYLVGVNWTSSLEFALRLISWALIYPAVRARIAADPQLRESFAPSVYLHLKAIRGHLSRYSSANNHLLGELAGLYVGATCFPWWKECEAWRDYATRSLEREVQLQFTAEGINREQAISYQLFTLEFLLLAMSIGQSSNRSFSRAFSVRMHAALGYLASLATPSGDLPWFGDSDDGRGFLASVHDGPLEVVMQLGGLIFEEPRFLQFAPKPTAAALALMPEACAKLSLPSPTIEPQPPVQWMPDGGIAIIQNGDWKLVMDAGPLGYTSIAAHGHADALSLVLAGGDKYILIDSGTFAYHSHPEWRAYFRGTAAHNTARVDGLDQSTAAGRFLWSTKAKARLLSLIDGADVVHLEAEHDGYLRLPDPVLHRRAVIWHKETRELQVEDSFSCIGKHEAEIHWHVSEEVKLEQLADGRVRGAFKDRVLTFSFSSEFPIEVGVIRGAISPILGWRSPAFHRKIPIATIRCAMQFEGSASLVTRIDLCQTTTSKGAGEE